MEIVSIKQQEGSYRVTYEDGTVSSVPEQEGNRHYTQVLLAIEDGVEIEDQYTEEELSAAAVIAAAAEKVELLSHLTVTTASGKVFYADAESRLDLEVAIQRGSEIGIAETTWKLAEGEDRMVVVSIDELKEASYLALQTKAQLIGVESEVE